MVQALRKDRWVLLVRGAIAILFGILAILNPGLTLTTLALVFGVYAIIDGVMSVIMSFRSRAGNDRWWVMLVEGIISILAGIGAIVWPLITLIILIQLIAFMLVFTGIMQIVAAIRLRQEITGEFWLGLGGAISVIAGIFVFLFPIDGLVTLATVIGIYAIIFGVMLILLFFRLGSSSDNMTNTRAPGAAPG